MTEMTSSATDLKDQGNRFFECRKYADAISCYTKAIIRNPSVPTFFTNRALCHIKQKQWDKAVQDCRHALEMDSTLVKGHFFHGQSLLELNQYDESIASLRRAQDLAKDQKLNFGDDIAAALRLARKKRWNALEDKRIKQEIELQEYINQLIVADKNQKISEVVQEHEDDEKDCTIDIEKIEEEHQNRIGQVNGIFQQIDDRRKKREVPDFLCGKISFELLKEPVITPSGITYDKKDIEEHLQRVGHFDPVTRQDLTQDMLVPNLSMKEVVDQFLQENPWAEDY